MSEETRCRLYVLLGPLTFRSALFGVLSVVLWGLMAIPMLVFIALAPVSPHDPIWVCCGPTLIIPNLAGLVLGILGLILSCRGDADRVDRKVPRPLWIRLISIVSLLAIILNVFLSWPLFAIWYVQRNWSGFIR